MARSGTRSASSSRKGSTDGITREANRVYDDVLSLAGSLAQGRKDYGAEKISALAEATREFAGAMDDLPNLRVYVASAADSLDELADYVMETDIEQIFDDATEFARRHPWATLSVAIVTGVAAARSMQAKSSRSAGATSGTYSSARRRRTASRSRSPAPRKLPGSGTGGRTQANG